MWTLGHHETTFLLFGKESGGPGTSPMEQGAGLLAQGPWSQAAPLTPAGSSSVKSLPHNGKWVTAQFPMWSQLDSKPNGMSQVPLL